MGYFLKRARRGTPTATRLAGQIPIGSPPCNATTTATPRSAKSPRKNGHFGKFGFARARIELRLGVTLPGAQAQVTGKERCSVISTQDSRFIVQRSGLDPQHVTL